MGSYINENAAKYIFPTATGDYLALNRALERKTSPQEQSLTKDTFDAEHLTKEKIDSFSKQRKSLSSDGKRKNDFTFLALCTTAIAVTTLVLGFFFVPLILFPIAGAFGAAMIALAGLAIHRHIQFNKKINQLAESILPVRHQAALAKNFGTFKTNPYQYLEEVNCKDLQLISIASKYTTQATDTNLTKQLLEFTEHKRKEGKLDDSLLLTLYKVASHGLVSSSGMRTVIFRTKKYFEHTETPLPIYHNILEFYSSMVNLLSNNRVPKELLPLFTEPLSQVLASSIQLILLERNVDKMIEMMEWINTNCLKWDEIAKKVSVIEKESCTPYQDQRFAQDLGMRLSHLIEFVSEGHSPKDVIALEELLREKLVRIPDFEIPAGKEHLSIPQLRLLTEKTNSYSEAILKMIEKDPSRRDDLIRKLSWILDGPFKSVKEFKAVFEKDFGKTIRDPVRL